MKITDVKVETIRIPMKKPFRIAFAVQDHSLNVLVKISTDEGLWGIGEAAPFEPVTGESAATVLEALNDLSRRCCADPIPLDELRREVLFKDFFVFKGVMPLCKGHGTAVVPAVDNFRYSVHLFAAAWALDRYIVDVWTVKFDIVRAVRRHGF